MTKKILTQEEIKELLDYNQDTGVFTWKVRGRKWFKSAASNPCKAWNTRCALKVATNAGKRGYLMISIKGKNYSAASIAWLYATGSYPKLIIDHINHDYTDNSIVNLREVSQKDNTRNQTLRVTNISGFNGVSWHKQRNKWRAFIMVDGKHHHLGLFSKINDAISARVDANKKYNFHENHGRAA